ncbi:MAG: ABC transporter ATP-binding protein [Desulfobacterales bacterium]|jgi:branched-chain amino acid transport system ATP-binding protein
MGAEGPLLRVSAIAKRFGGVKALSDISFEVPAGLIMGLIGPNGAGKTTLFNVITGAYRPDGGRIHFRDRPLNGRKSHQIVQLGVTRTFQNVALFESMTVLENVMVGAHVRGRAGFWGAVLCLPQARGEEERIRTKALELLDFVGLKEQAGQISADLPFGRQRMVEVARALAAQPEVLLLDEPAAGLNAVETHRLGELLLKIRESGVTLILVEHDMSLTMKICDRIVVLDQGRLLAQGTPREIQADPAVMAAYLGTQPE